jgi:hypothetical protein
VFVVVYEVSDMDLLGVSGAGESPRRREPSGAKERRLS